MTPAEHADALTRGLLSEHGLDSLTWSERQRVELLGRDLARLDDIGATLAAEGLTVLGSMGQPRPHPLLDAEKALWRDLFEGLRKLGFEVSSRAQVVEANALARGD